MSQQVRVRFAPSPTGFLHVGGARTALYNYLFAKKNNGTFIIRVEDTDLERSTEESLKMQLADLKWLGLDWDEGIDPDTLKDFGEHGPYRQSERLEIYNKHAQELISKGKAYYCFLTDKEIDAQREEQKSKGLPLQVNSPYRDQELAQALEKIESGEKPVIRFKTNPEKKTYVVDDLIRNQVNFPSDMVGDFVLMRSNGMPVYNFCCAIDDALMKITHVFRAEEHLNNTLRQMMVYEALGFALPKFGHLSIILGEDKQKLSKRHGATSCHEYKLRGFLPEALLNFIALLGWSHPEGKEIISKKELCETFSEERLNSASAVFDETKLTWVNAMHLRALSDDQLWELIKPLLNNEGISLPEDSDWRKQAFELFKPYMETLTDAIELFRPLSKGEFKILPDSKEALSWESTKSVFQKWIEILNAHPTEALSEDDFMSAQNKVKVDCEVKGKKLFMPIRVAIIGKPHGAELKLLVPLMSKETLIQRAKAALESI